MKTKLTMDLDPLVRQFGKLETVPGQVAQDAYQFFRQTTPVRSGYAKRNTNLRKTTRTPVIEADYDYAEVLDRGRGYRDGQMRGSTQAPRGMTQPTIEYINKIYSDKIDKTT